MSKRKKLSKAKKMKVFRRDGFMCVWCFSPFDLTIDHIIPISKGGDNRISNLMTLCDT